MAKKSGAGADKETGRVGKMAKSTPSRQGSGASHIDWDAPEEGHDSAHRESTYTRAKGVAGTQKKPGQTVPKEMEAMARGSERTIDPDDAKGLRGVHDNFMHDWAIRLSKEGPKS